MDAARLQDGVPLHPHYLGLQLWLELGAIGAVLAATATMLGAFALSRSLTRAQTACAAGFVGSYVVFAHISFGAWQEWWIATAFIAPALIAAAREAPTTSPSSRPDA
jgi:O-antigen ligase